MATQLVLCQLFRTNTQASIERFCMIFWMNNILLRRLWLCQDVGIGIPVKGNGDFEG